MAAMDARILSQCLPLDESGRVLPLPQFEIRCQSAVQKAIQWREETLPFEETTSLPRAQVIYTGDDSRTEVVRLLQTIEAKAVYVGALASLGVSIYALVKRDPVLAFLVGTPFLMVLILLIPVALGLWRLSRVPQRRTTRGIDRVS